jgi:hypothetical protein
MKIIELIFRYKVAWPSLFALFAFFPTDAHSSGLSSARATAMGGSFIGLAKGVYAPLYNPANVGLADYREFGIEAVGIGARISNNSFTLNDYNNYSGAILDDNDKSAILGKIPSDGLKISADVEARALALSLGSLVVSFSGNAATEANLGKDALELFLNGNGIGDTFSMDGMYSEAIAYASAGVTYGYPIYKFGTRQIAVGATYKYIRGIAYEKVVELHGGVVTLATGYQGDGTMVAHTAEGGSGYAVDLGAALKLSDSYTAGFAVNNFVSSLTWNKNTEEHGYHFQFDDVTVENMDDDSIVVTDDYSREIESFTSNLPSVIRFGLARTKGNLLWAIDWEQGFRLAPGASSQPRLSIGAEYSFIGLLPLRAGYSLGGDKGSVISGGFGINLAVAYLDIAIANHSGLNLGESKGLHLAISTGIKL